MNARKGTQPQRGAQRAPPPDDAGSRGDFAVPEESLREPEPGEQPTREQGSRRTRRERTNERLGLLAALSLFFILALGLIAFFLYAAGF